MQKALPYPNFFFLIRVDLNNIAQFYTESIQEVNFNLYVFTSTLKANLSTSDSMWNFFFKGKLNGILEKGEGRGQEKSHSNFSTLSTVI